MTEAFVTPDLDAIACEIDIAAPPERVFRALTEPGELAKWFTNEECPAKYWRMDARKGGRYSYRTEKSATLKVNGVDEFHCEGEITEFDPPRVLAYTWVANWHDDKTLPTTVRWELTQTNLGTHMKVTHSGLTTEKIARDDYRGGWPGVVDSLKAFVEGR
jgi:uncharacterized protein YndB with AHSA1/START domain